MSITVSTPSMVHRFCAADNSALTIFLLLLALIISPANAANFSCAWSSAATGTWNVAANWTGCNGTFPNNNSDTYDATIAATGGAYTVTSTSSLTIGSFTLNSADAAFTHILGIFDVLNAFTVTSGAYTQSGGTFQLNGVNGMMNAFMQNGGILTGSGTLTVSGLTTLTGGGTKIWYGSGVLETNGSTIFDLGSLSIDGGRTWQNDGTATLTTASNLNLNPSNSGANMGVAGRIENNGVFDIQSDLDTISSQTAGGRGVIDNGVSGTFRKSVATGLTNVGAEFNNAGTVDVQSGTLSLNNGGMSSGDFQGAGTLGFGGGAHVIDGTVTVGSLTVSAGSAVFNAAVDAGSLLTVSSGTATFNNTFATGETVVSGGTALFNNLSTNLGTSLTLSSGVLDITGLDVTVTTFQGNGGTLQGAGDLRVSGSTSMTSGSTKIWYGSGVLETNGSTIFDLGSLSIDGGRTWQNDGTATLTTTSNLNLNPSNSGANMGVAGRIENNGVFDIQSDLDTISSQTAGGRGVIDNGVSGTFRKSVATGLTNVGAEFNNAGTVDVQSGTLSLNNGGMSSGDFQGAGTLGFGGGAHVIDGTVTVGSLTVSAGSAVFNAAVDAGSLLTVSSGTATFNNTFATGETVVSGGTALFNNLSTNLGTSLTLSSGVLDITGLDVTVTTFQGNGGTLQGAGDLRVSGSTSMTSGSTKRWYGSGVLETNGSTIFDLGGLSIDGGRTWQNDGTATLTTASNLNLNPSNSGANMGVAGRIENNGVFDIQSDLDTISSQTAGGRGVIDNRVSGTFRKSVATGLTNVGAEFNNAGTVDVQSGTLSLNNGGMSSGDFQGAGTLGFGGGAHVIDGTVTVGSLTVSAGSAVFNAAVDAGSLLTVSSGTATFNNTFATGETVVSGGTALFNNLSTNLGTSLTLSSGVLDITGLDVTVTTFQGNGGTLQGAGDLRVSGSTSMTSGSTKRWYGSGVLETNGSTIFDLGGLSIDGGRTWQNDGTATLTTASNLNLNPSNSGANMGVAGRIENNGVFDIQSDLDTISSQTAGGRGVIDNGVSGTFRKSVATGLTNVGAEFNNAGTVDVQSGTLSLNNGGMSSGDFQGAGTLGFGGGAHVIDGTVTVGSLTVSAGSAVFNAAVDAGSLLTVSSGTATFNNTFATGETVVSGGTALFNNLSTNLGTSLTLSSGVLDITGLDVTVTTFQGNGGTLQGAGDLRVSGSTSMTSGSTKRWYGSGVLETNGSTIFDLGGLSIDGGRTWQNDGTATLTTASNLNLNPSNSGANMGVAGRIENNGVFDIQSDLDTISSQTAGGRGVIDNRVSGTFRKSVATGLTNVGAEFNNAGTVDVQTGTLSLNGDVTQHVGNTLTGGTWKVADGASLNLNESGAVDITVNQGDVSLTGPTSSFARINPLTDNQGSFRLLGSRDFAVIGPFANSGLLEIRGGTFSGGSFDNSLAGKVLGFGTFSTPFTTQGSVEADGGTLTFSSFDQTQGVVKGTGDVLISGQTTLSGSTKSWLGSGIIETDGPTDLTSGQLQIDGGQTWQNDNIATITTTALSSIDLNPSNSGNDANVAGRIENNSIIDFQTDADVIRSFTVGGNGVIDNTATGTFQKSAGIGDTAIAAEFNNAGLVDIQTGTLNLQGGGTSSGDFQGLGALRFSGGTHTINGSVNVGQLKMSGDSATFNGTVDAGSVLQALGGTVTFTNAFTVDETVVNGGTAAFSGASAALGMAATLTTGTLNISSGVASAGDYQQFGGSLIGPGQLTVTGTATLSGGLMRDSGKTHLEGSALITGGINLDSGRILETQGQTTWSAGTLNLNASDQGGAGRIDNLGTGVFTATGDNSILVSSIADVNALADFPAFNNVGTFRKTTGTGITVIDVPFNNSGVVEVQSGTLSLDDGGTSAGSFEGVGTLGFGGGMHQIDGTVSIGNLAVTSGSATITNTADVTNVFSLSSGASTTLDGGTLTFDTNSIDGTFNFVRGAVKSLSDLTTGDLGNALDLDSNKSLEVVGNSTIDAFETLTLSGGVFTTGSLVNNGSFAFDSGTLNYNSVFVVGPAGPLGDTVTINANASLNVDLGPPSDPQNPESSIIVEAASLLVVDGEVNAGTRRLSNSGDVVLGGPAARIKGGQFFMPSGGELRGEGRVEAELVSSGTTTAESGKRIDFSAASTAPGTIMMDGGTLDFEQSVTNPNSGAAISGSGQLIVAGGLDNQGEIASNGGALEIVADVINTGTVTALFESDLTVNGTFQHDGILSVFGSANFIGDFTNNGTQLRVEGDAVFADAYSGSGPLSGFGSIFFNGVTNAGNSPGIFDFAGDSSFGSDHELMIELAGRDPSSDFDRWEIGGKALLDGRLSVVLLDGYRPADGDDFEFFSATDGIFGAFDEVIFPELAGFAFAYRQTSNALSFSVSASPVPVPPALWLLSSGLLFLLRPRKKLTLPRSAKCIVTRVSIQRILFVGLLSALSGVTMAVPGDPNCLSFPGDLTFTDQLITEIGGTVACSEHDQFAAGGTLTINGATMVVILINDYPPSEGDTFQVLSFGALAGSGFAAVDLTQAPLAEPLSWNTDSLFVTGELSVVGPAPEQVPIPLWVSSIFAFSIVSIIFARKV